jgi:hypothetical protein
MRRVAVIASPLSAITPYLLEMVHFTIDLLFEATDIAPGTGAARRFIRLRISRNE